MSVIERGFAHIIKDLGGNKRSWESQPPWVNDGSKYVPYIYSRDESKKCYCVQVGLIGAVIYDTGVVEFYDPELKEIRVKGEEWEIWSASKKATLVAPITWSVIENNTGVYITREQSTSKPNGNLKIIYGFIIGGRLKHTVTWTSTESNSVTVQVKQVHLMDFDKVTTDIGVSTSSKSEKSTAYLFSYGSKGFWLFENQYAMVYDTKSLEPTLLTEKCLQTGEIDFAGKKVTYTFGDWTLTSGESLVVDPDSATLNTPTEDGYITRYSSPLSYTRYKANNYIIIGGYNVGVQIYRGYIEWSVSSIPDTATITDTIFKYHNSYHGVDGHVHAMSGRPSTATDANLYADIGDGTVYVDPNGFPVAGTNKQVDLGADADTDLKNSLVGDWFAIGIQADAETSADSDIYSQRYSSATPKPTLYVEYTTGGGPIERSMVGNSSLSSSLIRAGLPFGRSYSPTASLSSVLTRLFTPTRSFINASSLSSSIARGGSTFTRSFSPTSSLSSAWAKTITHIRSLAGNLSLSSAFARLGTPFARTFNSAISISLSVLEEFVLWLRSFTGNLNVSSEFTRNFNGIRSLLGDSSLSSAFSKMATFLRAFSPTATLASAFTRGITFTRSLAGSINLSSSLSKASTLLRSLTGDASMSSVLSRYFNGARSFAGNSSLSSTLSRTLTAVRSLVGNLNTSSSFTRQLTAARSIIGNVGLGSALSRYFNGARTFINNASSLSASLSKLPTHIKTLVGNASLSSSLSRLFSGTRVFAGNSLLSSSFSRLHTAVKSFTGNTALSSAFSRVASLFNRALTSTLTLSSSLARLATYVKGFAGSLTLSSSLTRFYSGIRPLIGDASISSSFTRLFTATKSFIGNTSLTSSFSRFFSGVRAFIGVASLSSLLEWAYPVIERSFDTLISLSSTLVRTFNGTRTLIGDSSLSSAFTRFFSGAREFIGNSSLSSSLLKQLQKIRYFTGNLSLSSSYNVMKIYIFEIIANDFPMSYIKKKKAQELRSKVS